MSLRRILEAHAYSGTAFYASDPMNAPERYAAGCECGNELGIVRMDEEKAHAELRARWSAHVALELALAITRELNAELEDETGYDVFAIKRGERSGR